MSMVLIWLKWRFYEAPRKMFLLLKRYLAFLFFYFSIYTLIVTLFSPWHRYRWSYPKTFNIQLFFETFTSNALSRIMGAIVRIFLVIFSIFAQLIVIIIWFLAVIVWIFLPLIFALLLVYLFL